MDYVYCLFVAAGENFSVTQQAHEGISRNFSKLSFNHLLIQADTEGGKKEKTRNTQYIPNSNEKMNTSYV